MNIFTFSLQAEDNPRQLIDKHVVKMLLEHCQLLSTAHRVYGSSVAVETMRSTHVGHPSTQWVLENSANYLWLLAYTLELAEEYSFRYNRVHSVVSSGMLRRLQTLPWYPLEGRPVLSPVRVAMKPEFKVGKVRSWTNTIDSYRNYYVRAKIGFSAWTGREPPEWFVSGVKRFHPELILSTVDRRIRGQLCRTTKFSI